MDLLTYQLSHEQSLIMAAHKEYAKGNIGGAVGFLVSLARLLNVQLPRRPMPRPSIFDTKRALDTYFFTCSEILSKHLGENITEIRAKYGQPFKLIVDDDKTTAVKEKAQK